MTRLPRLPLIYRGVANTYAVSVDVTDYANGQPTVWKSISHLSEAEALDVIGANGVSLEINNHRQGADAARLLVDSVTAGACWPWPWGQDPQ